MNTHKEIPDHHTAKPIGSLPVLGARLTWIVFGPIALLGITWGIVSQGTGWFTGLDAAFGVVVCLMLLARWVEHRSGSATTLSGAATTDEQCERYLKVLPIIAAVVWTVANLLGNHVLK